jgi:primosomal protein N' (replication factor Y)
MVTKGLDFDKVSLVGIFNADRMIHFPDFRSYERAFQLITQVSGRAGRREKPGVVVIQTSNPEHPLLQQVLKHTLDEFYKDQLNDRAEHNYPPFSRLIEITVKHTDKKICRDAAETFAAQLKSKLPTLRIMGPGEPIISKIRNQFLMSILIKIPRDKHDLVSIKKSILENSGDLLKDKAYRSVKLILDVDPV